jgi:hypothetical protein
MPNPADLPPNVEIVLADPPVTASQAELPVPLTAPLTSTPEPESTLHVQTKKIKAPEWFSSMVASNSREKRRFSSELVHMRGAWPLLMKQRNGGKWTAEEKTKLKMMVRSASSVSPYLFVWAIPGSVLLLPFLAWFLDKQRRRKSSKTNNVKRPL